MIAKAYSIRLARGNPFLLSQYQRTCPEIIQKAQWQEDVRNDVQRKQEIQYAESDDKQFFQ